MKKLIIILGLLAASITIANAQTESQTINQTNGIVLMEHNKAYQYAIEYTLWLDQNNADNPASKNAQASMQARRVETIINNIREVNSHVPDIKVLSGDQQSITIYPNGDIRIVANLIDNLSDDELLPIVARAIYQSMQKINFEKFRLALSQLNIADSRQEPYLLSSEQMLQLHELYYSLPLTDDALGLAIAIDDYVYELLEDMGKDPQLVAKSLVAVGKLQQTTANLTEAASLSDVGLNVRLQKLEDKYIDSINKQALNQPITRIVAQ